MKVLVGRILVEKKTKQDLSFLKQIIPDHIAHQCQDEMSEKSVIVPLPMMLKDEKFEDVVDILDGHEQHLEDIFVKAKVIEKPNDDTADETPPVSSGQSSSADQAMDNFNQDDDKDDMKKVSVAFGAISQTVIDLWRLKNSSILPLRFIQFHFRHKT